jgi:hypothetical protein
VTIRWVSALLLIAALVSAQDRLRAGSYNGTWSGGSANGELHLTLRPDGEGKWSAEVGFTLAGEEIPCKMISLKIDGASIAMTYEFDLQGNKLQSATQGTLRGKTLEGTYRTLAGEVAVDEGTWKAETQ